MARQVDPLYDLDKFKHRTPMSVRFADLDVLGHVNHAKYLTYMEQARMQYAADVWGWDGTMSELSMIVAFVEVNYFAPLFLNDTVWVYARVGRFGTKSFDLLYTLYRADGSEIGQRVATGKTAMVMFDYQTNQTIAVSETWLTRTRAYEHAMELP